MKIKILYVIENIFFGGGERSFAQIINGLNKEEYEIYVACMPRGEFVEQIRNSANILPINLRNMFNLFNICKLAKIMKVSYSTYQEHLRKAEAQLIPNIYKELEF